MIALVRAACCRAAPVLVRKMSTAVPIPRCPVQRAAKAMNNLFLTSYSAKKRELVQEMGRTIPVLIVNGDELVMELEGRSRRICYVPEKYHLIKSIAHIACAIHTLAGKKKEEMEVHLRDLLAEDALSKYHPLLRDYQKVLRGEMGIVSLKEPLLALCEEAAQVRLDALDAHVRDLPRVANIAILVMGPPMPRDGELCMQYFEKHYAGHRLIYAESIYTEEKAKHLLATHICDEKLGGDLLHDPQKMKADFLKDAVRRFLHPQTNG